MDYLILITTSSIHFFDISNANIFTNFDMNPIK